MKGCYLKNNLEDDKFIKKELRIGTKIEMEHTNKKMCAKVIAKDHLSEYPNYYTKGLLPMEKKLKLDIKKTKKKYNKTHKL